MLKNTLLFSIFILSCGETKDSEGSSVSPIPRDEAPAQGFMITKMEITAANEMCNTKYGTIQRFIPLDKSRQAESLLTCFEYERKSNHNGSKKLEQNYTQSSDGDHLDFDLNELGEFCKQNGISDLGAMLFGQDRLKLLNPGFGGYPCIESGKGVTRILVKNDSSPESSFDMRLLKFFPDLKELRIMSNRITGFEQFDSSKNLKILFIEMLGGGTKEEQELLHGSLAKNLSQIEYVEILNHDRHKVKETVDSRFLQNFSKLRAVLSFVELNNLSSLNGNSKIEILEIPKSDDTLDFTSLNKIKSIRYEADQGSNVNSDDLKIFEIHEQVFVR